MKIIIYQNREVYKEESKIGNDSENKVETLEFEFPEEYKDFTKYIEFQTKDEKYVDLIEDDKYIITRAIAKYGKIKAQIVLRNSLENDVAVFKSDIFELKVSKSINATIDVPIEYPTWIDNLTRLKQDIEHAEHERVSNENERISAEKTRQENFTEMQKTVENATSNIKDLKEEYNENAKQKTEEFNKNFEEKQKAINDNAEAKTTAFGENAEAQTKTFNTNSDDKLAEYNRNHTAKMKEFDDNYDTKTKTFDDNAADKQNEFDENASDKLAEYNQNAKELINKVEQVQAENETLKAENKLIKEQIPSASASGNSVHIEDSGTLDFDWKINGGHAQAITTQPENYIDDREARGKTILEATSLYLPIVNLKAGNGYYFKIFDNNNKIQNDSRYLAVDFYDENKVKIGSGPLGFPHNFTEEVATKLKYAKIYYNGNDTDKVIGNTVIKKIGLKITSSVSADDIDMFVPDSPSPDYPSEVETVGSIVNELKLKNGKSIKAHGLDVSIDNGIITINGTANEYYPTFLISGDGEIETRSGRPSINANPNWYNSITLTERDYTLKFEYISGDGGTAYRPYVFIHTSDGKNSEFSQGNSTKIKNYTGEIAGISFYVDKNQTFNNYKFRVYVVKGTYTKDTIPPYSSYGMGSVEIDVVNKNLYNGKNEIGGINNDGSLNNNADRWRAIDYINVENSTDISINIYNITTTGALGKYCLYDKNYNFLSSTQIININTVVNVSNVSYFRFWFLNDKVPTNTKIQVETGSTPTTYAQHQSQTAIMPIQQEMLTGDYISSVEHHEWGKLVLTGNENFAQAQNANKLNYFYLNYNLIKIKGKIISNMLKSVKSGEIWNKTSYDDVVQVSDNKQTINIMLSDTTITTLQQFKEKLKELYNAETPIIIYYELTESIDLELTSEQKAVRDTKLYTYKNITNISLSDELASVEVEYKKDQDTINKNYENRLAALEAASIS